MKIEHIFIEAGGMVIFARSARLVIRWFAVVLLCVASVVYAQASAQEAAIGGRVLVDASGTLRAPQVLQQLQNGAGEAYQARRFYPYQKGQRIWFLLEVPPSQPTEQYLVIPQTDIPLVTEYTIEEQPTLRTRSGSLLPVADWWVPHTKVAFEIGADQRQIFLAAEPDLGMYFAWRTLVREAFEMERRWYLLATGIYIGLVLFLLGVAVYNGLRLRDWTYAVYAVFVLQTAMAILSVVGIGGFYVWRQQPWLNWYLSKALPVLAGSMLGVFLLVLVYNNVRAWLRGVFYVLIAAGFTLAGMYAVAGQQPTMWLAIGYFWLSFLIYLPVTIWYGWRHTRYIWWMSAGMVCLYAGAATLVLRNLHLLPAGLDAQLASHIGSSLELVLMFAGLHVRTQTRRDQIVREAALGDRDPTTGTFNEKIGRTRLDLSMEYALRNHTQLAVVLVRSSNYSRIKQEYGSQVAAVSSVHAVACLRQVCGESDTLVTMNNRDFLLIFKEQKTELQLRDVLSRIVAAGLRESESLPVAQTLTFYASFSLNASLHLDETALIKRLTEKLDEIALDPGKTIRSIDAGTGMVSQFGSGHGGLVSTEEIQTHQ